MQNQPRYSLMRRFFFPYSGEVALTRSQGVRVIITWALSFPLVFLLGALLIAPFLPIGSQQRFWLLLTGVTGGEIILFGAMAWFVVFITNQSVRLQQIQKEQKAAQSSSNSGGRYGS
ncbi:hypothetical protein [Tengunoibacter tsumagoiensis]|uniref:Uncharacterized protein n=1 Tax=Tengunoibacter tsumagoiensis TaxID=2014871 RepID=A0A401ZU36_9CHLR|nr:hypothetical protein [Tengunoibacter tsumagoiensis]GCE10409.1 hypothetical protein KTT_02680 [Tengunoibacter tsumagoiensis]